MKLRNAVLSASVSAAALLAAQGVMAGGLKDPIAPAPITTSWEGLYIGGHIGAGEASIQGIYDTNDTSSQLDFDRIDLSGVLAGAHVGYNWDWGPWIVGIEADVSAMDWSGVVQAADSSEEAEGEFDLLYSVRARVGIPVDADRRGLLYATGGFAVPDASLLICESGCASSTTNVNVDLDEVGGVVGAGFEWAATDRFRLRFETLYYFFDESEVISDGAGPLEESSAVGVGLDDAWTVRIGATWYLGR